MRRKNKLALVFAAALALTFAPAAAHADSADPAPPSTAEEASDLSQQIADDPDLRFVSVAEAVEEFGFDPAATPENAAETAPEITPLNEWWGCEWDGKADYPHVTNGEASVHGYWVYISGDCPATADVTVNLQALGCSDLGCTWINQASDSAPGVTPGSGTGHWATPHKACANSNPVAWRGEVHVGLANFWHPYGPSYGAAVDLNCAPA